MSTFRITLPKEWPAATTLQLASRRWFPPEDPHRLERHGMLLCATCCFAMAMEAQDCRRCSAPIVEGPALDNDLPLEYGRFTSPGIDVPQPIARSIGDKVAAPEPLSEKKAPYTSISFRPKPTFWYLKRRNPEVYLMTVRHDRVTFHLHIMQVAKVYWWFVEATRTLPGGPEYVVRLDENRTQRLVRAKQEAFNALRRSGAEYLEQFMRASSADGDRPRASFPGEAHGLQPR